MRNGVKIKDKVNTQDRNVCLSYLDLFELLDPFAAVSYIPHPTRQVLRNALRSFLPPPDEFRAPFLLSLRVT